LQSRARHLLVFLIAVALLLVSGCTQAASNAKAVGPSESPKEDFDAHGRIVDAELFPIVGATISIADSQLKTTTDAKGEFRVGPLPTGSAALSVEAAGYKPGSLKFTIPLTAPLQLVLEPQATTVPYHETRTFDGYYDCMLAARYPTGNPTWPCIGIIDLTLNTQLSRDKWLFPLTVDQPGFVGLLAELTWKPQSTASWMSVQIRDNGLDEAGAKSYYYNASLPNLRGWAYAGKVNEGASKGAVFYPKANETAKYLLTSSSASNPSGPADFQLWLAHRSTLFATLFYHRLGRDDFTVLPDK
jgi:hypothetical protein